MLVRRSQSYKSNASSKSDCKGWQRGRCGWDFRLQIWSIQLLCKVNSRQQRLIQSFTLHNGRECKSGSKRACEWLYSCPEKNCPWTSACTATQQLKQFSYWFNGTCKKRSGKPLAIATSLSFEILVSLIPFASPSTRVSTLRKRPRAAAKRLFTSTGSVGGLGKALKGLLELHGSGSFGFWRKHIIGNCLWEYRAGILIHLTTFGRKDRLSWLIIDRMCWNTIQLF